ncbi:coenzyme F420-0:L-glutamate ligase [Emcibacter sp. SYSU 3D8]|uniref:coenzyme F420-0:L-glutamate ligase n=1 Tax=Emcibacter sp. SYSU 3D8 TaxID=3133969 RepID=UPI0031FE4DF3
MSTRLSVFAVPGIPLVQPGDDIAAFVLDGLAAMGETLADGDIVVLAQKIVSKAEGRLVSLEAVTPSGKALELAGITGKDPRVVELVLRESNEVLRAKTNVMIVEQKLGLVIANAGIDRSNVEGGSVDMALLLPLDPDASARGLRETITARAGVDVAVVIADSVGRAWRYGTTGMAIGCAGLEPLWDQRGDMDMFGKVLEVTEVAVADQIASAANLAMGEASERTPVAIVRGLDTPRRERPASVLVRAKNEDMFR